MTVVTTVGVLALQGDFGAHAAALGRAGLTAQPVRSAAELLSCAALVLPGGESTAMWKLMEGTGIAGAIVSFAASGRPVLATCAGAILLAREVRNPARKGLGILPLSAVRNAYGRQLDSAVVHLTEIERTLFGEEPLEAVFIRAPKLADLAARVEILARRDGDPVLVRHRNVLAATFHPELSPDGRVHRLFAETVAALSGEERPAGAALSGT